jgi:hypothetical protein
MQPFFKPSEQQALRPGLLNMLTNKLIGGYSRGEVMQNRALNALDVKDVLAKRKDADTLKEQMGALRQKYANGGGDFRSFAAELAMLRPELSAQLAGMVNAMEVAPQKAESPIPNMSWVRQPDGTYKQLAAPQQYEERREDGGVAVYENGQFKTWKIRPPQERDRSVADEIRKDRNVNSLRSAYAQDVNVKRAQEYASAYQGIVAAGKSDDPQTNLAMMYEAVKMRDPNAVREGELGLQLRARGVPQWLMGTWERVAKGQILTDTERKQIHAWAKDKMVEQLKLVAPTRKRFADRAKAQGLEDAIDYIAFDPADGTGISMGGTVDVSEINKKYGLTPKAP